MLYVTLPAGWVIAVGNSKPRSMFGSSDAPCAAGVGAAFTTSAGAEATGAAACAWACDVQTWVVAAVKTVKATRVILLLWVMTGPDCRRRADAHAARRASKSFLVCFGGTPFRADPEARAPC
ncbi:MAG TPA: hypothetical protein VKQ32_20545 [Polyangia bacterium]|nr:hypothetical protein [Polyangia bacterium]